MKTSGHLDEIILASDNYINEELKHKRKDSFKEFARGQVLLEIANNQYLAQVIVGYNGNDMVFYDIVDFTTTKFMLVENKKDTANGYEAVKQHLAIDKAVSSTNSILNNAENVNTIDKNNSKNVKSNVRLRLKDSEGNELTAEQQEFFKNSKVRDEQGNLQVVYHNTNGEFFTFKNKPSINRFSQGKGFYFTPDTSMANEYGKNRHQCYVNLKNPFFLHNKVIIQTELEKRGYNIADLAQNYGIELNEYGRIGWGSDETTLLKKMGYDGVISTYSEKDTIDIEENNRSIIVAYKSNQIKLTTNKNPTKERDIRYSLPEALKTLGDYSDIRKRHIGNREYDTISRKYSEIAEFIRSATKENPIKRLHIGIINDRVAEMVLAKTSVDIKGYEFVLSSNYIAHIFDGHSQVKTEKPIGQTAVNFSNIENIIETVIFPDDVTTVSDKNGTALRFEKYLNGKNIAITIVSTKKNTLMLKSAWIINGSGGRTPLASAIALAGTSETNGRSSTTNSIAIIKKMSIQ